MRPCNTFGTYVVPGPELSKGERQLLGELLERIAGGSRLPPGSPAMVAELVA